MVIETLKTIADGARLYLVPVGPVWGAGFGLKSPVSGLSFAGFSLLERRNAAVRVVGRFRDTDLEACLAAMPEPARGDIEAQLNLLATPKNHVALPKGKALPLTRPLVMGVLNVTPDSFSDGGQYLDHGVAVARARQMIGEGADVIDIGGESTRPGAKPVWEGEELERVIPVIEALRGDGIPLSIDSRHAAVMDQALVSGAHIINDVSALTYDPESLKVAAGCDAPIVLMHAQGTPQTMQDQPDYDHVLLDVYDYLLDRIRVCEAAGIVRSRLIVDPGLGFGKRVVQDNVALMNGLGLFHTLGCPLLVGASRKRFIGAISAEENAERRIPGSLAAALKAAENGAHILRVHDVWETAQALKLAQAFHDGAIMDLMAP